MLFEELLLGVLARGVFSHIVIDKLVVSVVLIFLFLLTFVFVSFLFAVATVSILLLVLVAIFTRDHHAFGLLRV